MGFWRKFTASLLFTLILMLVGGCATPNPPSPAADYYLTSDFTYLRDAASFDGNVVGQLYKGDRVERLEVTDADWWRVRSRRTGQVGWVPDELFTPQPVPVTYFYVTQTIQLRECPKEICQSLQLLSRGDQVQKIEQNDQGWWRVLVAQSRNLGWLPARALAADLKAQPVQEAGKPYFYVAVRRLKLQRQPQAAAEVVKLLQANDQLEKLDQNPAGWFKVRQPASGAVGWVPGRALETLPVRFPRPEKRPKKKPQPAKPFEAPAPPPPAPLQPEPEIM